MPILRHSPVLLLTLAACSSGTGSQSQAPAPAPRVITRVDTVRIADTVAPRLFVPDTALQAGRFDNGKMWTFEYPPLEYFREAYHFTPDSAWFVRARAGASRNCDRRLESRGQLFDPFA